MKIFNIKCVDNLLIQRPANITNIKKNHFKQSLLNQINYNKIKKETEKIQSLKNEELIQKELLKK